MTDFLTNAIRVASEAHMYQLDKGGRPYILHPLRVMQALWRDGYHDIYLAIAVLHDVVEDSDLTLDELSAQGFSDTIVSAVDRLSLREGEAYLEYLDRLVLDAYAAIVKRYDVLDNLDPLRLHQFDAPTRLRLAGKYHAALTVLEKHIRPEHLITPGGR